MKKLSDEDRQVWREAMHGAPKPVNRPVKTDTAPTVKIKKLVPAPLIPDTPPKRAPTKRVEASIDLHGMTQAQAHTALNHFLDRQIARGVRRLEIITGKSGVLHRLVPLWLEAMPYRPRISRVTHAAENRGGIGALHVLLKPHG